MRGRRKPVGQRSSVISTSYLAGFRGRSAAARALSPHPAAGRISAADGGASPPPAATRSGRPISWASTATRCARKSATSTSRSIRTSQLGYGALPVTHTAGSIPPRLFRCINFSGHCPRLVAISATLLYKCIIVATASPVNIFCRLIDPGSGWGLSQSDYMATVDQHQRHVRAQSGTETSAPAPA